MPSTAEMTAAPFVMWFDHVNTADLEFTAYRQVCFFIMLVNWTYSVLEN